MSPVHPAPESEVAPEGPVIRDKRRIDPQTGQRRAVSERPPPAAPGEGGTPGPSPAGSPEAPEGADGGELAAVRRELEERTADLQRVQAEYANYRRRVARDQEAVREAALANVLTNLLPVLDDLGRARDHGELEGGFKAVADSLEAIVGKLGLTAFGTPGEPFDPTVHEALMHTHADDVTEPTAVSILQPGYRIGERIMRPARVAVADPVAE